MDPAAGRVVLDDHGDLHGLGDCAVITANAVCVWPGETRRRDQHSRCASLLSLLAELNRRVGALMAGADHNGNSAIDPVKKAVDYPSTLRSREFVGLAHHPQNGQAVHAFRQQEICQAVDAVLIDASLVRERRGRNRKDTVHKLCIPSVDCTKPTIDSILTFQLESICSFIKDL